MEDLTGKQLGPYQIVAPLGEGGMAAVYKAFQPGMDRYVALKILPRHFANDPLFVGRFDQEAKVLAKLQHPHILPVFDFGQADGYTYIVMPFLQSGDLTDLLRGSSLSLTQIRRIISQVGDALDYAHAHGLIHRDVKPSNVLLDERGNCLLTDFGIAKIIESGSKLTLTGGIIGTPTYMSPEQGLGEKVDGRSDIYALGIMLYQMATGRVPYQAETPMAIMIKHLNDPLPPPRHLNPALPEAVERIILKALAKQPDDRYATAGEMVRALQAAIPETGEWSRVSTDGEATLISAAGATLEAQRQATGVRRQGQKWLWPALGLVLLGMVGAGIILLASRGDDKQSSGATPPPVTAAPTEKATAAVQPTEAIPTQTPTIQPTATLPVATPLPVSGLYDNFDDPAFDGKWDTALWEANFDQPCQAVQQEGAIRFTTQPQSNNVSCDLTINQPALVGIEQLGITEARLQIADDLNGKYGNQGIGLSTEDLPGGDWFAFCGLTAHPDELEAYFEVTNYGAQASPDISQGLPAAHNRWYTFRLEVTPDPLTLACYVDGTLVGSVTPADAPALRQARFRRMLDTYREAGSTITTYVDDVRLVGGSEVSAELYDDFENPAFAGQYNPELWDPWQDINKCEAMQEEGALRFSCSQPDGSGLNALHYQGLEFGQIGFVETRLKLGGDIPAGQGGASLYLANSLENWAGCGLYGGADLEQAELSCNVASYRNDIFNEEYRTDSLAVAYDTWHTVRIEMDSASGKYTFFVDSQPLGTYTPADLQNLRAAQFEAQLRVYLEEGTLISGYFDDVRIGPLE